MSRLLFAAARGARIECAMVTQEPMSRGGRTFIKWVPMGHVYLNPFPENRSTRIHPDDEHLQYGPISTVLRDSLMFNHPEPPAGFFEAFNYAHERFPGLCGCQDDAFYVWQILFIAELLADEGL
jgi:hypothetical protein